MNSKSTAADAAIDHAARLMVTPPPDEDLLRRLVARLSDRPDHRHRVWWIPVASAAALAAWLVLGSDVVPPVAPASPARLVAESWAAIAPLALAVTAAVPPARTSAAGPSRDWRVRHAAEEGAWELAPVSAPAPLEVGGLSSVMGVVETIDVSPLAVEALRSPSALSEMKE